MRTLASLAGLLLVSLSLSACGGPGAPPSQPSAQATPSGGTDGGARLTPQAQAVMNWLDSGKRDDIKAFQAAWSAERLQYYRAQGWDTIFADFKQRWDDTFGDYKSGDFKFEFKGDDNAGDIIVRFKSEVKAPPLRVKREASGWKIHFHPDDLQAAKAP